MAALRVRSILQRTLEVLLLALLLFLLVQNLILRRTIGELEGAYFHLQRQMTTSAFQPGELFAPVAFVDLDGHGVYFDPGASGSDTLLAVVDPACPSCRGVLRDLDALVAGGDAEAVLVISVGNAAATAGIVSEFDLGAVTVRLPEDALPYLRHKLSTVPQLLAVTPTGLVARTCGRLADCLAR